MLSIVLKGLVIRPSLTMVRKKKMAVRVEEHLSGKSGKFAIHEHVSSCKDCHSCYINNIYTLAQANTDFEAKVKRSSIYKKYRHKLNNQIYLCGSSFLLNIFLNKYCFYYMNSYSLMSQVLYFMLLNYYANT